MFEQRWRTELYLLLAIALVSMGLEALGWLPGLIPMLLYAGWQLWQFRRLTRLLNHPDDSDAPEPCGLSAVIYDYIYRQRRDAEQRRRLLKERIRRFEQSSASLPDGVISLDRDGKIEWFNATAGRLMGLESRDIGQRIINVVRSPQFVQLFDDAGLSATTQMSSPRQSRIALELLKVNDGGMRDLLVVRDITQLRQLEQVRRDFVANASHELRTPLTVISGYLEALSALPDGLPANLQQPIEQMSQQAVRMQGIIADMLALAALDGQQQLAAEAQIDVAGLLNEVKLAADRLTGDHKLVVTIASESRLRGAEKELHSAVSNLVYNAVQHTPPGSQITLCWDIDDQGRGCLSVADNGEGIPA
ncbi:MAG: DUF3329 domain-containing protein [Immundisolibacteraceae bacterium]|nr:DUF3329 domain-containing protein [Immundisolibacteraceae bacterium]